MSKFDQSKSLQQLLRELRTLRRRCKTLIKKNAQHSHTAVRVRAEELARRYEFVVNSIGDPIGMVDRQFNYQAVNDALCYALRVDRAALLGTPMSKALGAEIFEANIRRHLER